MLQVQSNLLKQPPALSSQSQFLQASFTLFYICIEQPPATCGQWLVISLPNSHLILSTVLSTIKIFSPHLHQAASFLHSLDWLLITGLTVLTFQWDIFVKNDTTYETLKREVPIGIYRHLLTHTN